MCTTVGFIGAGQLARMAQQAAIPLGLHLRLLAETPRDSGAQVVPDVIVGDYRDLKDLRDFARGCDVVTFDHELTDPHHLADLEAAGTVLAPTPRAKRFAQDKLHQRRELGALGFAVPPNAPVDAIADVEAFAGEASWPVVLKAARGGYDGRGVWVVRDSEEARAVVDAARERGLPLLVESFVEIDRELAVVVARSTAGETVVYPAVETVQSDGICNEVVAPAAVGPGTAERARELGLAVAEAIGATGILAVELFETESGLVINEVAARPHNSGHWTIEGAVTSQFENHLRAVCGWPLGATECVAPVTVMVNILGRDDGSDPSALVRDARTDRHAHVHLYGKEARPHRKLGHVTITGREVAEVRGRAHEVAAALGRRLAA